LHVSARIAQADACKAVVARVFARRSQQSQKMRRGAKKIIKRKYYPLKD